MKDFDQKVAVVTGAASGMGRAMAVYLAGLGCHLAIADRDKDMLDETASLAGRADRKITSHRLDVSVRDDVYAFAELVEKEHGQVDIVINNAGISTRCPIEEIPYDYFESLMNINFWGVVYGCKAFLPALRKRPEAHIANVSSIYAIAAFPKSSAYNASKAAVRAFTETLAAELIHSNIGVSCVFPGAVRTNVVNNSLGHMKLFSGKFGLDEAALAEKIETAERESQYFQQYYESGEILSPEAAAAIIVEGIKAKSLRILVGEDARELDMLVRNNPDHYLETISTYEIFQR